MSRESRVGGAGVSRRGVLGAGAWAMLGGALAVPGDGPALARELRPAREGLRPRSVVFLVSDGMSMGTLTLAEPFSRLLRGRGTAWSALLRRDDVAHGYQDTASLNSLVTDSSAASSAWGSGSRIVNGAVNMLPDGSRLTPLGPLVRASGRRFGLVTTTTITHATPAGFAACQASRDQEAEIAPQYLEVGDVLLGGGMKFFSPSLRKDGRDLLGEFRRAGYTVCTSRRELLASPATGRLLGLFHESHLPFTIDRGHSPAHTLGVPTLSEMTGAALAVLDASPDGFLLQVEGGRVDHAAHTNDPGALLNDQLAFDDALAVVLEYATRRPDTLVVITSDHGNANPGLNGVGEHYDESDPAFARLLRVEGSYAAIQERLKARGGAVTDGAVIETVRGVLRVELTPAEAERIRLAAGGKTPCSINRSLASLSGVMGETLSNHFGIGWIGTAHTADLVPVTAVGPGQERFRNLRLNTDAFTHITALFDIRHRNPAMTPEEARRFPRAAALPGRRHWV